MFCLKVLYEYLLTAEDRVRLIDLLGLMAVFVIVDTCSFPWINSFFEHLLLSTPVFLPFSVSFCLVQRSQPLQP